MFLAGYNMFQEARDSDLLLRIMVNRKRDSSFCRRCIESTGLVRVTISILPRDTKNNLHARPSLKVQQAPQT